MLGCGHVSHIVKMYYIFENLFLYSRHDSDKLSAISNDDHGRVFLNCKFHYPQGRGSCARAWSSIKYIVMMTKEGTTKIVNFMTHGAGILILGCGHISHYTDYASSSTLSATAH